MLIYYALYIPHLKSQSDRAKPSVRNSPKKRYINRELFYDYLIM